VTIQLTAPETASEPRLLTDTYKQNAEDQSFAEKLKTEKERLGLLFSPLAQMSSFFASPLEMMAWATQAQPEPETAAHDSTEGAKTGQPSSQTDAKTAPEQSAVSLFAQLEAAPAQTLNRQFFQELLSKTNLLVPNLAAQPLFNQAFQAGELKPSFDLQSLIDELIKQVNLVKSKGQTELSLTLNQEELGDIFLKLTSLSGRVSVLITASAQTKQALDARKNELEHALRKAAVTLDQVTIEEAKKC
jgi:flagellar hook-length control protein FliK